MKFLKMHGLGNDFVVLDRRQAPEALTPALIKHLCNRHTGVGCDQLVVLQSSEKADFKALFYNGDGSESGACGNASRCVADIFMNETGREDCAFETRAGVLRARRAPDGLVEVDMGKPCLDWREIPLAQECDTLSLPLGAENRLTAPAGVSMGNPHCVFFIDDFAGLDLARLGPYYEHHALFPQRTNVEFAQVLRPDYIRLRTWERGAGLTLACGSAACATVVAGVRRGLCARQVTIAMDGGELQLHWREEDGHVFMTGPVAYVFEGFLTV